MQVYKEKCRQEMEMLRKKEEELLQVAIKENEDKLTEVRRRSKRAEELLQGMQVNGGDGTKAKKTEPGKGGRA